MLEAGSFTVTEGGEGDAAAPIGASAERMPRVIALSKLVLAKDNARRGGKAELEQLAADIAAHGVLQNLIGVEETPGGKVRIVAGGRRLRALQLLVRRGQFPAEHLVPVQLVDDDAAAEASLAENVQRLQMSAADEATAYATVLEAEGVTPAAVAHRFGVTERHVLQRLRLARLAEPVFEALKAGRITLEAAKAWGSVDDPQRQAEVWARLGAHARNEPYGVRASLANSGVPGDDPRARWIGRDDYLAAGGRISADLFAEEADETWLDEQLLDELCKPALADWAAAAKRRHGFADVLVCPSGRTAKLVEGLEEHVPPGLRPWAQFDPTERPTAERQQMVVVATIEDGPGEDPVVTLLPEAWVYPRAVPVDGPVEDSPVNMEPATDLRTPLPVAPEPQDHAPRPVDEDEAKPLSGPLRDEMAMRRRDALALAVATADDTTGKDLTDFLLFEATCRTWSNEKLGLGFRQFDLDEPIAARDVTWGNDALARALAAARADAGDDTWVHLKDPGDRWHAFLALPPEARRAWGRLAAATALKAWGNRYTRTPATFHAALAQSLGGVDAAAHWRPDDTWFARARKSACIDMLAVVLGGDVSTWAKWKLGELAPACAALARGDAEKLGALGDRDRAAVEARGLTWLPADMRFTP